MPADSTPPDPAELLALLRSGDEAAAEAVFEQYADRLTRLAQGRLSARLSARIDAEDIVQSAWRSFFVAVRAGRFRLEGGGDLWRLLVEVTLHKLYRQAARHQSQRRSVRRESAAGQPIEIAAYEPTPAEAAAAADELEALMEQLPERGRQALALRLQGYEHEEIAQQLACHERTVRRLLAEARRQMAARAGGDFIPSAARRPRTPAPTKRRAPEPHVQSQLSWNDFVLRSQIGAGASGKVYRAWQKSVGREVAIKFLRKSLANHPPAVERFLREAHTLTQLNHPGIVAVHGVGRSPGGGLFLVMDLVQGRDLERVARGGAVQPRAAATWVASAARIVHFVHQHGILHCDLKPSNLLLDSQGQIRVTDFGLAIPLASGAEPDSLLAGTPAFMAPEQVDPAWGPISPRTDVYGLGAVLYYLLQLRPPHIGRHLAEILADVASARPVQIDALPAAGQRLKDVLGRCLDKTQEKRFETAAALAQALENAA